MLRIDQQAAAEVGARDSHDFDGTDSTIRVVEMNDKKKKTENVKRIRRKKADQDEYVPDDDEDEEAVSTGRWLYIV